MKIQTFFLDNTLELNCRNCHGDCCKGFDYMVTTQDEYRMLCRRFPFLRRFSGRILGDKASRGYDLHRFSGCWFLKGRSCSIHKEDRHHVRTVACRLYPFMNIVKCKDTFIVSARHRHDCLHVAWRGAARKALRMDTGDILRDVRKILRAGFRCKTVGWNDRRMGLEKRILRLSRVYADRSNYLDFAVRQLVAAQRDPDATDIRRQLQDKVLFWKKFLQVEDLSLDHQRIAREMAVLTPMLRLERWEIGENVIPLVLLAVYVAMLLHVRVRTSRISVRSYVSTLEYHALRFVFLNESPECKKALLRYAAVDGTRLGSSARDLSLCELASRLQWSPEDRLGFLSSLGR